VSGRVPIPLGLTTLPRLPYEHGEGMGGYLKESTIRGSGRIHVDILIHHFTCLYMMLMAVYVISLMLRS